MTKEQHEETEVKEEISADIVSDKVFNQAVKRNIMCFLDSFRFQLTDEEYKELKTKIVTSKGRGGRRYLPYVLPNRGLQCFRRC